MSKPRDKMIAEIARAQGVIMALYGIVRDVNIGGMVDEDKNGSLGDVVGITLRGLNSIIDLWDDGGDGDEQLD